MSDPTTRRQFGDGPLSRLCALVYTLLVVEVLLLLTTVPTLVLLTLLARDASNLPLAALGSVPLGPALAAALTALRRPRDLTDLRPAAAFWHGYARNAGPVLRLWVPMLALLTVIGINLTHLDAARVPRGWAVLLVLVAATAVLWGVDALVITTLFSFRTRDVARLAGYFLVRAPGVTAGLACLGFVAAGVVTVSSEAALALLGSGLTLMLLQTCRPMTLAIERDFVVPAGSTP